MYAHGHVSISDALTSGISTSGSYTVEVTAEAIAALTPDERRRLADYCTHRPDDRSADIMGARVQTLDEIIRLVRVEASQAAARAEAEARDRADRDREYADQTARCREVLAGRLTRPVREQYYAEELVSAQPDWPHVSYDNSAARAITASDEARAWQCQLDDQVAHARKLIDDRRASGRAQEAAAEAAEAQARAVAIAEAVRQWGNSNQQARLAADVLPEDEAMAMIRDHVFGPLAHLPRYERLSATDVPHADDCADSEGDCKFIARDLDTLSADQWTTLQEMRPLLPDGAVMQARSHEGRRECCDGQTTRCSVRVSLVWHGISLSREYALA